MVFEARYIVCCEYVFIDCSQTGAVPQVGVLLLKSSSTSTIAIPCCMAIAAVLHRLQDAFDVLPSSRVTIRQERRGLGRSRCLDCRGVVVNTMLSEDKRYAIADGSAAALEAHKQKNLTAQ